MTGAAPHAIAVSTALSGLMRSDRGRLLAILASRLRDVSLAEEALQEASLAALSHWGRNGLPASPYAWLLTAARRKAIDRLRGAAREGRKAEALARLMGEEMAPEPEEIPDERLRLIFACCHPALELKSRVALTLRTVCGLSTGEIARLFLDTEPAMGQRISRAKAKIGGAGIAFEIPDVDAWGPRLQAVLATVYLIFTAGYAAPAGEPRDLCREAAFLIGLIDRLRPADPEIEGAWAMMLLTEARRAARIGPDGATVPPGSQDRSLWDHERIAQGRALLATAFARRAPGPFQIKAAIADCQMQEPGPDWPQIAALYQALEAYEPTPVIALNKAVALAEAGHPARALQAAEALAPELGSYQPFLAARAALLAMNGQMAAAVQAYELALTHTDNEPDTLYLSARLAACQRALGAYGDGKP